MTTVIYCAQISGIGILILLGCLVGFFEKRRREAKSKHSSADAPGKHLY